MWRKFSKVSGAKSFGGVEKASTGLRSEIMNIQKNGSMATTNQIHRPTPESSRTGGESSVFFIVPPSGHGKS